MGTRIGEARKPGPPKAGSSNDNLTMVDELTREMLIMEQEGLHIHTPPPIYNNANAEHFLAMMPPSQPLQTIDTATSKYRASLLRKDTPDKLVN